MAVIDSTPLSSKITDIRLISFNGEHEINIVPQVYGLELYESLFSPLQKAVLTIYDPISLFNNFPLLGEEFVTITVEIDSNTRRTFGFCIESVKNITPSTKNREQVYTLTLISIPALADAMINVQHAYNGTISSVLVQMMEDYIIKTLNVLQTKSGGLKRALELVNAGTGSLFSPGGAAALDDSLGMFMYKIQPYNIEDSNPTDSGTIIIPNMKPLLACQWLASKAVPEKDTENYMYLFWQATDGFHFETIQKKLDQKSKKEFVYYADNEIANKLNETQKNHLITNIIINNRITTLDKIAAGYFQNGYFEINLAQQTYKVTPSTLKEKYTHTIGTFSARDDRDPGVSLTNKTNTDAFIDAVMYNRQGGHHDQGSLESMNRIGYGFNNRADNDVVTPLMNRFKVWGNTVRSRTAFNQIDLHITVPGDFNLQAGNIITIRLPKMEGFNEGEGNKDDKLIVGRYIISDVKHVFGPTVGGVHSTVLRINKDAHNVNPDSLRFEYGTT